MGCAWNGNTGVRCGLLGTSQEWLPHVTDSESSCLEVDEPKAGAYCRDTVSESSAMVHMSGKKSSKNKNHQTTL